jgi:hypothetical protein
MLKVEVVMEIQVQQVLEEQVVMQELEIQVVQDEAVVEEEEVLVATTTLLEIQVLLAIQDQDPVLVVGGDQGKVLQMNHFLAILVVLDQVVLPELQIQEVLGDLETLELVEILAHLLLL